MLNLVTFVLLSVRHGVEYSDTLVISFVLRSGERIGLSKLERMLNSIAHAEDSHFLEIASLGYDRMVFELVCNPSYAQRFLNELIKNSEPICEKYPQDLPESEVNRAKILLMIAESI